MNKTVSSPSNAATATIGNSILRIWTILIVGGIAATYADAERRSRDLPGIQIQAAPLPNPLTEGIVSLHGILAFADRHSPLLGRGRARLELGDAAVDGASLWLPHNPEFSIGAGPRRGVAGRYTDLSASISQRVEIAGERGLRIEAAERSRRRFNAELDEARWHVHRDVHAAFHRALVAREKMLAADRLLAFQERLLDIARRRFRAGDVSELAVRVTEGELSQSRVAKIAAKQAYRHARLELGALAGWPETHPPEPAGSLDAPLDPPPREMLWVAAQSHQPRLRTLRAIRAEAEALAHSAEREAWPEPTLGLEYAREGAPAGFDEAVVIGTFSVSIPLFARDQGARAKAHAEVRLAEAEQQVYSAQLAARLEQDRSALTAAAARVRSYGSEILPTFEKNLHLIQRAYELGEIDILEVSVARERFLRTQSDALDAHSDYFQAVANLEASIGTDIWPDERHDLPLQPHEDDR
ncbi:MAG: hypothetical protein CME06_14475 [Gemmatimonadetes bacterium]|nr:hypothetical protein [Gemmatimonadota bacterium]